VLSLNSFAGHEYLSIYLSIYIYIDHLELRRLVSRFLRRSDGTWDPVAKVRVIKDPVITDDGPIITDLVVTDPGIADPVITDPVITDPVITDPVITDPVITDPVITDPVITDHH
jgi:hypothetical protein